MGEHMYSLEQVMEKGTKHAVMCGLPHSCFDAIGLLAVRLMPPSD